MLELSKGGPAPVDEIIEALDSEEGGILINPVAMISALMTELDDIESNPNSGEPLKPI